MFLVFECAQGLLRETLAVSVFRRLQKMKFSNVFITLLPDQLIDPIGLNIQGVSEKTQPNYYLKSLKLPKFEHMYCIPFESTAFLLSNYMQFGYLNGITYHFIYTLESIPNFKASSKAKSPSVFW